MRHGWIAALALLLAVLPAAAQEKAQGKRTYKMGLGQFPYDLTPEAMGEMQKFVQSHSDMMSFSLKDGGIPWEPALADQPFPGGLEEKWKEARAGVPAGYKVFLAITPLNGDKNDLHGNRTELENLPVPDAFKGKAFDDRNVVKAYANYCRRAVAIFKPDWVSIAIDCTEIVNSKPKSWEPFVKLCRAVREAIKKDFPRLPVGVTHDLALLWNQQIARAVKPSLREIDFLGLSFIPFLGLVNERTGGRALPNGREQWAGPLKWVRKWSEVPLAMCDTAYTSKDLQVPILETRVKGDPQIQKEYLTALLEHAEVDKYHFVNWAVPIDPEKLLANFPSDIQAYLKILQNVGLLDGQLRPKPALDVWDKELLKNPKPQ